MNKMPFKRDYALDKGQFENTAPLLWKVALPPDLAAFGGDAERDHPGLGLFESGRELGPAHEPHDRIRLLGGGRYSFGQDELYFSTSDGSDPNANGHTYIVRHVLTEPHHVFFKWLVQPPLVSGLTTDQQEAVRLIETEARRRLAVIGEDALGTNNYFRLRLDSDLILADHEAAAVAFLREKRGRWRRIWDIGAGIGQIGALLALDGFEVIAIERNAKTRLALEATFEVVARKFPEAKDRLRISGTSFPEAIEGFDVERDAAIVFCCTFTDSQQSYDAFCRGLCRFDAAIVEFRALFTRAMREGQEVARAEDYCAQYRWIALPIVRYPAVLRPGLWQLHFVEMRSGPR